MEKTNKTNYNEKLETLVKKLVTDPTDFLTIMEFSKFIGNLPYGSVSGEELRKATSELMDEAPQFAIMLLDYDVQQALYFQKSDES